MRICSKVKWSGGEPATEGQMKWRWTGLLFIWWQGFSQRFRSNLQICTLKTVWRGKLGTVKFRARLWMYAPFISAADACSICISKVWVHRMSGLFMICPPRCYKASNLCRRCYCIGISL